MCSKDLEVNCKRLRPEGRRGQRGRFRGLRGCFDLCECVCGENHEFGRV